MTVDVAKIKADLAAFSSGKFWKPVSGRNYIRILPPWSPEVPTYYYALRLHWVGSRYVLCGGENCVICHMLKDSAFASVLKDKIQTLDRFLVNMVDLSNLDAGVRLWNMPITVWRQLNQYFLDPKWGDLTDAQSGRNITIVREGTDLRSTKYTVYPDPTPSPADPSWLSGMKDLKTVFEEVSFDKLVELLQSENIHLTPQQQSEALPPVEAPSFSEAPQANPAAPPTPAPQANPAAPPTPAPPESPASTTTSSPEAPKAKQGPVFDPSKMQELLNKLKDQN